MRRLAIALTLLTVAAFAGAGHKECPRSGDSTMVADSAMDCPKTAECPRKAECPKMKDSTGMDSAQCAKHKAECKKHHKQCAKKAD